MQVESRQLKLFLLDAGLVSSKEVEDAEKKALETGENLGDVLIKSGKITGDELRRLNAYILGIPFVSLEKEKIDFSVLSLIPEPIARNHNIVAYKKQGNDLEVAMLDPHDLETIDFIKKKLNIKILPRLTDAESLKIVLRQYQKTLEAEFGELVQKDAGSISIIEDKDGEKSEEEDLKKLAEDLPIVRIIDTLLHHAILQRASDIHIEPTEKEVIVRYRIDGMLRDAMILPIKVAPGIIARLKILSNLKIDEKRLPQDGRFKIESPEEKVSFRVSILPVRTGEKAVLRLLREGAKGMTLEWLGFAPEQVETMHDAMKKPVGLILVTGPTGSGKTTTLYTVLEMLNTPEVNISTIEDPIEYQMPRVNQTQVRADIGLTFANGLRALLRQDPNVIMVGEIRDNETAALAINAALTGHLVLSTLHTNSAAGAIPRLLDMKAESFLLASTVNVIVAQRLVRQLSKDKEKYFLTPDQIKVLSESLDLDRIMKFLVEQKTVKEGAEWKEIPFYKPKLTKECPTGYLGRMGIHEILKITETVKNLIMKNANSDEIEKQAKQEGMMTMFEDGIVKAAQGITSIEEIMRVTKE